MTRFLIALLAILCARDADPARSPRPFLMKRFECTGQPYKYTTVFSCQVTNQRNSPQLVDVVANITESIKKVYITSDLYAKNTQTLTPLYGTTFEYCEFMMNKASRDNPVAAILYNYAKHNFPQIIKPCPISGMFNVSRLAMDRNMIPPYVTPGSYLASQRFFTKRNVTLLHYVAEFSVSATSIFNKSMSLFTFK